MSNTVNQDSQRNAIIGNITALMKQLHKLAPHPDQPLNKGPLFIKSNPYFKVANDHEGMLGGMIMEGILGTAFSEAVSDSFGSWTQDFDANAVMELYSTYITEIEEDDEKIAAHGQGTLARLSEKPISKNFNLRSRINQAMQAFMDDMPKRLRTERDLAFYAKKLEQLEAQATPTLRHSFAA